MRRSNEGQPIDVVDGMLETHRQEERVTEEVATLAHDYGRLVFNAAYRVLGDATLAEDVQQDVFLKLVEEHRGKVNSWPAYLVASAVRGAIDQLRHQKRWGRLMRLWAGQQIDTAASAEQVGIASERGQRLRAALANLPRREAQCFSLRYLENLDISEIAQALALSENNINVTLHRARRRLETQLGDPSPEATR
ncbi:MAG: sigma-70 family RNA polymerase sigma factor [Dokdonella sp.]